MAKGLDFDYLCIGIQEGGNTSSLFNEAKELDVSYITAETIHQNLNDYEVVIDDFIQHHTAIYVTVCLDVFSQAHAPGVSAPQVLGLFPWQLIPLLKKIVLSRKVVGFDIAELSPPLDCDNMTATLAANLVSNYIHTLTF